MFRSEVNEIGVPNLVVVSQGLLGVSGASFRGIPGGQSYPMLGEQKGVFCLLFSSVREEDEEKRGLVEKEGNSEL